MSQAAVTLHYSVGQLGGGGPQTPGTLLFLLNGSGPVTLDFDLPLFPGFRTTFRGVDIFRYTAWGDDFEGFSTILFDPTDAAGLFTYAWSVPNCEAGSDFTDVLTANYPQGAYVTLGEGWGWDGAGAFDMADNTLGQDDLQGNVPGSVFLLTNGTGWAGFGRTLFADYFLAWDDLQTYAVGSITALTAYRAMNGSSTITWAGNGNFILLDYASGQDDLQSYPAGAITVLNGGTGWNGNGGFY